MRSVVRALAAFSLVCVAACTAPPGTTIDGRGVQAEIDARIGANLKTYDARLDVAPSKCPDEVDVSGGKTVRCTIGVDGIAIPVDVTYAPPPQQYAAKMPGFFYERRMIESLVASTSDDELGGKHEARCTIAAYAVLPTGAKFDCAITGGPKPISIAMTTGANGVINLGDLPGHKPAPTALERKIAADHAAGKTTLVPGTLVAPMIDRVLGDVLRAMPGGPPEVGHARCPPELDLTGPKHARCVVPVSGGLMREDISIEASGYHMQPLDAVIDMRQLATNEQRSINATLAARSASERVTIACSGSFVVVPVPSDLYCDAHVGAQRAKLQARVLDARGQVQSRLIPVNAPTPP